MSFYKKLEMELINQSNGPFMHFYALQHKFCIEIVIITITIIITINTIFTMSSVSNQLGQLITYN